MTDSIHFRPACKEDCPIIAKLYSIASDGVADYIWSQQAAPGEDLLAVGARRYAREDINFSYKNCTIAEIDGEMAGMMVAFPIAVDAGSPDKSEVDPILLPYAILEQPDSYYICGVALFPEYRGQGLGTRFMERAEEKAREGGFRTTSLVVFEGNQAAKRLYERLGYREVAREAVVPHPMIHHTGYAVLMVKDL